MYGAVLCWRAFRNKLLSKSIFYWHCYLFALCYLFIFCERWCLDWINKHNAEDIAATMKAEKPWIEETREFFGLVILIVVLAIDYFYAKKRAHR